MREPDKKLDTITTTIGHGAQVESVRTRTHAGDFNPAFGVRLHVFSASDHDESGNSPAEAATVYLNKQSVDQLIAALEEHRARMEPVIAKAEGK